MLRGENPGRKPSSHPLKDAMLELKAGTPVFSARSRPGGRKFSPITSMSWGLFEITREHDSYLRVCYKTQTRNHCSPVHLWLLGLLNFPVSVSSSNLQMGKYSQDSLMKVPSVTGAHVLEEVLKACILETAREASLNTCRSAFLRQASEFGPVQPARLVKLL